MEKGKRNKSSARVYLHDAYDEWTRQRDIFFRLRPRISPTVRLDEEFACHLLRLHATRTQADGPGANISCCKGDVEPPSMPKTMPRLTPIKGKQIIQGSHSADKTSSLVLPNQDNRNPSDIQGEQSSHASSEASKKSSLSDHTYIRKNTSSISSVDMDSSVTQHSLSESTSEPLPVPTPQKDIFEPSSASTPHDKASAVEHEGPSTSTRRGLFCLPSHDQERDPVDTDSSDSEDDINEDPTPEFVPLTHHKSMNIENSRTGLDLDVFDIDLGAQETVGDDSGDEACDIVNNDENILVKQKKCIVYEDKLMELLVKVHGTCCARCKSEVFYRSVQRGTAIIVTWECEKGHKDSWASQPRYSGMFAGNLNMASAILLSGNSFQKVATMCHFMNLRMMSRTTFGNIERLYVAPAVGKYYKEEQEGLLAKYDKPVVLSGDGRSDSPGYSATFCTYSLCDEATKKILHTTTVMVQEASGKSPNMERIGFERAMDYITSRIEVEAIVTDAHPQIGALMKRSEKYAGVKHQWDIWHGSKNFAKKVSAASQQKNCQDLQPWLRKLSNHFWYSSQTCKGSGEKLAGNLVGVLHHIVNEHEWLFTIDGRPGGCQHAPLEADKDTAWLQKGSPAHEKLRSIVMDKRFLKTLHYYEDFRHTGSLELFHSSLLMYAPKRSFFSLPGYCLRVQLAVLDANFHCDRKQAVTKDGEPRWKRKWNKRSKQYTVSPVKEKKTYAYIPNLIARVFRQREETPGRMSQHISMTEDDPRRLHPTISMRQPVPTAQLVEEHKSRFT